MWKVSFQGKVWKFQTFEEARKFANECSNFLVNGLAAIKVTK